MGMRLADVDNAASVSIVNAALAKGVFTGNADNASMTYFRASPNTNPIYEDLVLNGRADFVAANTIVDKMNDLNDPRRKVYYKMNIKSGGWFSVLKFVNTCAWVFTWKGRFV